MTMNHTLAFKKLIENCGLTAYRNEPLSRHSTWRIGGPADFLVEPNTIEHIRAIVGFTQRWSIPLLVIGKASNILFDDDGLRGIVVKLGHNFNRVSIRGRKVIAQCGVSVPRLAHTMCLAGLSGLEHAVGIPGTLGGLVNMNGGSQRKSISEVIEWVKVIDRHGHIHVLSKKDCGFSYRHSIFQNTDLIIVEAGLKLQCGESKVIHSKMLENLRSRRSKFPLRLPNCGSVFKSATEMYETVGPLGRVIEEAGLKGLRVGNAEVSRKHANFIVNKGSAEASDVRELIRQVRAVVYEKMGIWMDCEVRYVTSRGEICLAHEVL